MPRLALIREPFEMIKITLPDGREIGLAVVEIKGWRQKMKYVIDAPADILVDRAEIAERRKAERRKAEHTNNTKEAKAVN